MFGINHPRKNITVNVRLIAFFIIIVRAYPPFTRKRIVSLTFERDVCTRLEVTISEVCGPPVFHIKVGASR